MKLPKVDTQNLPAYIKPVLYIVGGILGWKFVVKPLFVTLNIIDSEAARNFKDLAKKINTIPTFDGSLKPRITELQAQEIAQTLFYNMDRYGTKFEPMVIALRGLNGKDLQLVYKAFGVQKYFGTGRGVLLGDDLSLFQWFNKELTPDELEQMREIWRISGLTF